ncbi:hypothetical protein M1M07_28345 [Rhodococcus sp. HM1]|uniref:hypothetical protein n=1 Tax=Rhodococcus sp. HM1 TaxID=2937759 RepID=UPI00200B4CE0|nr:hypothetical protein [Rhodococcus sp. HM1]MCK8675006.1 hypothetical protein [Rhodococcus sp. HM1]
MDNDNPPTLLDSMGGLVAVQITATDQVPEIRVSCEGGAYQDLTIEQAEIIGAKTAEGALLGEAIAAAYGVSPDQVRISVELPGEWKQENPQ